MAVVLDDVGKSKVMKKTEEEDFEDDQDVEDESTVTKKRRKRRRKKAQINGVHKNMIFTFYFARFLLIAYIISSG